MSLTPVEVRHLELRRGLFGYRRSSVARAIEEVADSFESVWRERADLGERVHVLEGEVAGSCGRRSLTRSSCSPRPIASAWPSARRSRSSPMGIRTRRSPSSVTTQVSSRPPRRESSGSPDSRVADHRGHYSSGVSSTAPVRTDAARGQPGAARLRVRVAPGASRAAVVGRLGDVWKLRVRAAPERGRANAEVARLLADTLGVSPRDVHVVAGHTSRDKVVEVEQLSLGDAERRLASRAERA